MHRLCACFLFVTLAFLFSDNSSEILKNVRETVAARIKRSANYTCVQTIDRSYFVSAKDLLPGCAFESQTPIRKEIMHDRLRLDVAVSKGQEIYSWHGENQFSTSAIDSVVRTGPISSGGFVGYLQNIFLNAGVQFTYTGESLNNQESVYGFTYTVPLPVSHYHVQAKQGSLAVPFHGSFSAFTKNFELASLEVIADKIPDASDLCSIDTEMNYQVAHISGTDALIPALFSLRIDNSSHVYTVSRNEYSQCREFRGESTLRFDDADSAKQSAPVSAAPTEWLPAGLMLHIALRTPIDEKTAYTGDPVEGVLLESVKVSGDKTTIPKGASLKGLITRLEDRYEPERHYYIKIEFDRLSFGNAAFLLHAVHRPSGKEAEKLYFLYGEPLPLSITDQLRNGTIIFDSRHLRLDRRFSGLWETLPPAAEAVAATSGR
ncbi:MAG: hypothetical protein JO097_13830 [Acidobacteriaceae bacterium]|nr:hypothetical protein [Acidobacteriaceae bacterium]MBV9294551.1 hypothetical protein [Acidobacteriaceae bacterium]MBV9765424.1 hypothetical protein [Acidobacteriaceae bacterium]